MTTPNDVVPEQESPTRSATPPIDDEPRYESAFREINARRARVENTELLRHLRGL